MTSSSHSPFNLRLRTWVTVAAIFSGALIFTSCNSNAKDELAHHHHDHGGHHHAEGHDHEAEEGHDHEHEGEEAEGHSGKEIVIEPEQAKMLGIETTAIKPSPFSDVLKVSGRIMETASATGTASAPTSGIVTFANGITEGSRVKAGQRIATVRAGRTTGGDPNAAARANMEAAKRELDRLKPLHEHGIVSTAEYNAALAAYNSAKALYSPGASAGAVVAPVSGTLTALSVRNGGFVEAGAPVASISSGTGLTLRADVPQRHYGKIASIKGVNIKTPYSDEAIDLSALGASQSQGGTVSDNRPGYVPVYFTFTNGGNILPGTPAEVFLLGEVRENVISVPVSALSEQQGRFFVFRRLDDECYEKVPVTLGANDGTRVEIKDGIKAGDNIVTKGTVSVRLAESSGVVPEGHSHNH